MMLYKKECRRISRSVVYLLYCVCILAFFFSQYGEDVKFSGAESEPLPGRDYYGESVVDDPDLIMPKATSSLIQGYLNNRYETYPIGFIHIVRPKSDEIEKLEIIIEKLTGEDIGSIKSAVYADQWEDTIYYDLPDFDAQKNVSYDEFKVLMTEVDDILGGGSDFSPERLVSVFGETDMNYDQALKSYNELAKEDRFSNGYARLFCDYSGIFLSLLPVFVAAALMTADKRGRMEQLIYSRQISSAKLVMTRFAALTTMMMIPVVISAVWAHIQLIGMYGMSEIDNLAFAKYTVTWLLPAVTAVTGFGMLMTEVFSGITAIFVQFIWWFASLLQTGLESDRIGMSMMIRHNTIYARAGFMSRINGFYLNRAGYMVLGMVFAALAVIVFDKKREGKFSGIRVFKKVLVRKSES